MICENIFFIFTLAQGNWSNCLKASPGSPEPTEEEENEDENSGAPPPLPIAPIHLRGISLASSSALGPSGALLLVFLPAARPSSLLLPQILPRAGRGWRLGQPQLHAGDMNKLG